MSHDDAYVSLSDSSSLQDDSDRADPCPYDGPFVGRARVIKDYTPTPYDTELLTIKVSTQNHIILMNMHFLLLYTQLFLLLCERSVDCHDFSAYCHDKISEALSPTYVPKISFVSGFFFRRGRSSK